jgi:hypothetical protein
VIRAPSLERTRLGPHAPCRRPLVAALAMVGQIVLASGGWLLRWVVTHTDEGAAPAMWTTEGQSCR